MSIGAVSNDNNSWKKPISPYEYNTRPNTGEPPARARRRVLQSADGGTTRCQLEAAARDFRDFDDPLGRSAHHPGRIVSFALGHALHRYYEV